MQEEYERYINLISNARSAFYAVKYFDEIHEKAGTWINKQHKHDELHQALSEALEKTLPEVSNIIQLKYIWMHWRVQWGKTSRLLIAQRLRELFSPEEYEDFMYQIVINHDFNVNLSDDGYPHGKDTNIWHNSTMQLCNLDNLMYLALRGYDTAVKRLAELNVPEAMMIEVAMNTPYGVRHAVPLIKDQNALVEIALNGRDHMYSDSAVAYITDKELLYKLFEAKAKKVRVWPLPLRELRDNQELLKEMILDPACKFRAKAVEEINRDDTVFLRSLLDDPDKKVMKAACTELGHDMRDDSCICVQCGVVFHDWNSITDDDGVYVHTMYTCKRCGKVEHFGGYR